MTTIGDPSGAVAHSLLSLGYRLALWSDSGAEQDIGVQHYTTSDFSRGQKISNYIHQNDINLYNVNKQ